MTRLNTMPMITEVTITVNPTSSNTFNPVLVN